MNLTPRVQQVLQSAEEQARSFGHDYVGTEHVLLALLTDRDGIAGRVLSEDGISARVEERIRQVLQSRSYNTTSNQVLDSTGNVVGTLQQDEKGRPVVKDADGRVILPGEE